MKWFSTLIIKLLINNGLIDIDDKEDIKASFDKSFDKAEETTNPVMKKINTFFKHPIGIVSMIWGYVTLNTRIQRMNREANQNEMEEQFKAEFKSKMMSEMLNED